MTDWLEQWRQDTESFYNEWGQEVWAGLVGGIGGLAINEWVIEPGQHVSHGIQDAVDDVKQGLEAAWETILQWGPIVVIIVLILLFGFVSKK